MDGQVGVIRARRSTPRGTADTGILAYTAKYASAFYGPFREAVEGAAARRPQDLPAGPGERPGVAARARARPRGGRRPGDGQAGDGLPGRAARGRRGRGRAGRGLPGVRASTRWSRRRAERGWLDRDRTILETLTAIRRAGADVVLTYWATEVAGRLRPRLAHLGVRAIDLRVCWPRRALEAGIDARWRTSTMSNDPVRRRATPAGRPAAYPGGPSSRPAVQAATRPPPPRGWGTPTAAGSTAGQHRYPGRGVTRLVPPQPLRRAVRLGVQLLRDPGRDQGAVHPGPGRDRAGLRRPSWISGFSHRPGGTAWPLLIGGVVALFYVIFFRVSLEFYHAVVRGGRHPRDAAMLLTGRGQPGGGARPTVAS